MPSEQHGMERLMREFAWSPSRHRMAAYRLRAHPFFWGRPMAPEDARELEWSIARMSPAALRGEAFKLGEHFVDELERHEHDDPACALCRGETPIREVIGVPQ